MQDVMLQKRMRKYGDLGDIAYMALVGMKSQYHFPIAYSDKAGYIIDLVCHEFGQHIDDVMGNKRLRKFVIPRHIAMFFIKRYTNLSLKQIGRKFHAHHHTSVIHAVKAVQDIIDTDETLRVRIKYLELKIQN